MSLAFARAYAAGMIHNGITVHYWPGWETRGNGQTSNYVGMIWHHTASAYGDAYGTLVTGRAGLSGPLCNVAGNADGSVTIIAAHPANHAGASGGRSMGPLPTTNIFNKLVWGLEIVYPGISPMRDAQYHAALVSAGVVSGILARPTAEWCRGHAETSITGKWDPGYAPGRTVDLNKMRADVWPALNGEDVISDVDLVKIAAKTADAVKWMLVGFRDDRNADRNLWDTGKQLIDTQGLSDADVKRVAAEVVKMLGERIA